MTYSKNLSLLKEKHLFCKKLKDQIEDHSIEKPFLKSFLDEIDYSNVDVIYCYGINIDAYFSLLKNKKRIVFFEDNASRMHFFLKNIKAKEVIEDENVEICFLSDDDEVLKTILWKDVFLKKKIVSTNKDNKSFFEKVNHLEKGVEATFSYYSDCGYRYFNNFFVNLLNVEKVIDFSLVKNKINKMPAIICGAGPSFSNFKKYLPKLQNKALIFAGGSCMNLFSYYGMEPHFSSSLDPNAPYDRFKEHFLFEVPFIYQNKMSYENFSITHAPKVIVGEGRQYLIEEMVFPKLNISPGTMDGGWTVGTLLIEIAYLLGCNPIFLSGMDFCCSDKRYAEGVEEGISNISNENDWQLAISWINEFSKNNDVTLLQDISFGGQKIKGVKNISLEKEMTNWPMRDFSSISHILTSGNHLKEIAREKVVKIVEELKDGLIFCEKMLTVGINEANFSIIDKFLHDKISYKYLLSPLWSIWKHIIIRNIDKKDFSNVYIKEINKIIFFLNTIKMHLKWIKNLYKEFL